MDQEDPRQEEMEERMRRAQECRHEEGWTYQPAMEICNAGCGFVREAPQRVPDEEATAITEARYGIEKVLALKAPQLVNIWGYAIASAEMRASTPEGFRGAMEDLALATSIEMHLGRLREKIEQHIRRGYKGPLPEEGE